MDDATIGQSTCAGESCLPEGKWAEPTQLPKGLRACPLLDRAGDTLRKEKPPRNDVSVPGIHDDLDILIEQVTDADLRLHAEVACLTLGISCKGRPQRLPP